MLKADPKPNTHVASPPDVDEYLGVFYRGKLSQYRDGEIKQVQTVLLNVTGSLMLDKDGGLILVPVVLETIRALLSS